MTDRQHRCAQEAIFAVRSPGRTNLTIADLQNAVRYERDPNGYREEQYHRRRAEQEHQAREARDRAEFAAMAAARREAQRERNRVNAHARYIRRREERITEERREREARNQQARHQSHGRDRLDSQDQRTYNALNGWLQQQSESERQHGRSSRHSHSSHRSASPRHASSASQSRRDYDAQQAARDAAYHAYVEDDEEVTGDCELGYY